MLRQYIAYHEANVRPQSRSHAHILILDQISRRGDLGISFILRAACNPETSQQSHSVGSNAIPT